MTTASLFRRASALMGVALVSGAVLLPLTATAADSGAVQGYQISPPVSNLALDPGTSSRQTIKVTNLTDVQLTLGVTKRNFVAKGEEGEVELTDEAAGDPRYHLGPYFTVSRPSITVPPRGTASVEYVISVPQDAEPGGRYGSIVFNTTAGQLAQGQSGARVSQELAALVFLRINGTANEQLKIESFQAGKKGEAASGSQMPDIKTFAEYGPITILTRVNNLGNVHERPTGTIVIKNMLGMTTQTIKLDEHNVIPGSVRRLENELNRKWLFGRYTADLTMKVGTVQTLTASTAFVVVPYKVVAGVLVALLILFFLVFKGRKRFGRALRILAGRE